MKFLFFIEREYHRAMFEPLWKYIQANDLGETGFFCPPVYRHTHNQFFRINHRDETNRLLEDLGLCSYRDPLRFSPDITFVADYNYSFVEGLGTIVNIGHGTISKGLYFLDGKISRRENIADLMCVPGEVQKQHLSKAILQPIQVTGMPKLDKVAQQGGRCERLFSQIGLDPSKPTVLFAPTFNPEFSILTFSGTKAPKVYSKVL